MQKKDDPYWIDSPDEEYLFLAQQLEEQYFAEKSKQQHAGSQQSPHKSPTGRAPSPAYVVSKSPHDATDLTASATKKRKFPSFGEKGSLSQRTQGLQSTSLKKQKSIYQFFSRTNGGESNSHNQESQKGVPHEKQQQKEEWAVLIQEVLWRG